MINTLKHLYDGLASLVWYPKEYITNARRCRSLLHTLSVAPAQQGPPPYLNALPKFDSFLAATEPLSLAELEELFTRTFDINPVASLELGWHLYGETYERGAFLVRMRDLLRTLEIPEVVELPDHLSYALKALGRMEIADGRIFAAQSVIPAMDKMHEGFANAANPYADLLYATHSVIADRFSPVKGAPNVQR